MDYMMTSQEWPFILWGEGSNDAELPNPIFASIRPQLHNDSCNPAYEARSVVILCEDKEVQCERQY
jgi:hypothetical protein